MFLKFLNLGLAEMKRTGMHKDTLRSFRVHANIIKKFAIIEAGFDDKVLKIEQYMGRKPRIVRHYIPRYTEIAPHTCRRSFATNLYKMGYQMSKIMPMAGHSTEAQLRQYIGLDKRHQ